MPTGPLPTTDPEPEEAPWEVQRLGDALVLPPGLSVSRTVRGSARLGPLQVPGLTEGQRLFVLLAAEYTDSARRYVVQEVQAQALGEFEVTNALLRTLPVQRLLRGMVATSVRAADGLETSFGLEVVADLLPGVPRTTRFSASLEAERQRRKPSDPATMRDVAAIYRVAEVTSEAPLRAVERAFGLERSTASYWIRRARDAGHLAEPS